jgi:steroid 5-alpha reductase family enzyme
MLEHLVVAGVVLAGLTILQVIWGPRLQMRTHRRVKGHEQDRGHA